MRCCRMSLDYVSAALRPYSWSTQDLCRTFHKRDSGAYQALVTNTMQHNVLACLSGR